MFVYNKQKSQSIVSSMLEQVEIDASKNESKIRSEVRIVIEIISSEYKQVKT